MERGIRRSCLTIYGKYGELKIEVGCGYKVGELTSKGCLLFFLFNFYHKHSQNFKHSMYNTGEGIEDMISETLSHKTKLY